MKNLLKLIIKFFNSCEGPPMKICNNCGYDNLGSFNIKECQICSTKFNENSTNSIPKY